MSRMPQIAVSIRRNDQRRGWDAYRDSLCIAANLPPSELKMVEASESLRFEEELYTFVRTGAEIGRVTRTSELLREQAAEIILKALRHIPEEILVVVPSHGAQFAFKLSKAWFEKCAFEILEFDGDTVYAATLDLRAGVGLDVYDSEICHETRYTVDVWLNLQKI